MDKEFKKKLTLTLLDKLVFGLVVGVIILIGQFYVTKDIEERKSVLSYQTAVAQIRAEKIQRLWHATYVYGRDLASVLRSKSPESLADDLIKSSETFNSTLGQLGVYIGRDNVVSIDERIGMRFIEHLTEVIAKKDGDLLFKTLSKFQDDWISIQKELEEKLKTGPNI